MTMIDGYNAKVEYVARIARSAFAWVVGIAATIGFTAPGMVAARIPGLQVISHWCARQWGRVCIRGAGCRLRVEGLDAIDPESRFVVMVNHQSALDIPVMMGVLPARWRTVFWAKKSLFRIPVLGSAMRMLDHMPVDRANRRVARRLFSESLSRIEDGRSLLVFPEETYTRDGELLPFQRGAFLFALKTGLPVLPVGIWGTRQALPPGSKILSPTPIHVRFGPPIDPREYGVSRREELTERTRQAIDELRADPRTIGGP